MIERIRPAAVRLALVAMLLRALLPVGWMPGTVAGSPLVMCTANGLVQLLDPAGSSLTQEPSPTHAPAADPGCPFGAAASPALPTAPTVVLRGAAAPEISIASIRPAHSAIPPTGAHSARAPPVSPIA